MTLNPLKWAIGLYYGFKISILHDEYKAISQTYPEGREKESSLSDIDDLCKKYESKFGRVVNGKMKS